MKTLVIGDLHFDNKPYGLLAAQKKCIKDIIDLNPKAGHIIFLGDLMMHRKPYPSVLLALKEVIDYASSKATVTIIRGNHDSENKSDDGVTALSLFEKNACQDLIPNPKNKHNAVRVVTHTWYDHRNKMAFIPHYEDEDRIKEDLAQVPRDYTVFGHFGYCGSLNSAGDNDFALLPSDFKHTTYLGHIHGHTISKNITLLGTPYTTNFTEHLKENFYAVLFSGAAQYMPIEFGPRHLVVDYESIEENLDWINDKKYFTLLRIIINTVDSEQDSVASLMDKLDVGYVEVKYKPVTDEKLPQSSLDPDSPITHVSDALIEDYINATSTKISKEVLLEGLQTIHENKQSRDK
jgi:predicted phosphodiesterase